MCPYLHIFEFTIPTYGLCMALGLVAACTIAYFRSARDGLNVDHLLIIAATAYGCALVGAKLLYLVLTFSPHQIWESLKNGDFSLLSGGGLVFYGGLIGGTLGAFLGAKIAGARLVSFEAAAVPVIPLGHAFGRMGCFFAGCCYGFEYRGPLSVPVEILPGEIHYFFPVQLLEAGLNVILAVVLTVLARKKRREWDLLCIYLAAYAVERFVLEFLRGDLIRGSAGGLSTSQWISCGLLLLCLVRWGYLRVKSKE